MLSKRFYCCALLSVALGTLLSSGVALADSNVRIRPNAATAQSDLREGTPGILRPLLNAVSPDFKDSSRNTRRARRNETSFNELSGSNSTLLELQKAATSMSAAENVEPLEDVVLEDVDFEEDGAEALGEAVSGNSADAPSSVSEPQETEPTPVTKEVKEIAESTPGDELHLGNDNEDAPDAVVKIPEGDVSEADVKAAQTHEDTLTEEETAHVRHEAKSWRSPIAEKAVNEMTNDMIANLKKMGGAELYERWKIYNASIRRRTNSLQTGNELNSRCRLKWYEKLYQDPLSSVDEAERASNLFAQCFFGSNEDIIVGSRYARVLTDVPVRQNKLLPKVAKSPVDAIDILKTMLVEASSHHAKALAPLNKNELAAIMNESHKIFCAQVRSGHTVEMRGRAMYLIDCMEKINKSELYEAGESILSVLHPETLKQLANIDYDSLQKVRIGDNQEVGIISCEAGDILIGPKSRTVWDLDKYPDACCILDLGGDDVYREGSCVLNRPLLTVIDLGMGRDEYVGQNVAIQGGAILGVSVWYDDGGDDSYLAKDVCQGSSIAGYGLLINENGNDRYVGFLREQGTAICGFGVLIDRGGSDDYRGALFAQGVGGPGGFGVIADRDGDDHYYVGGYYFDSYPEHPGYDGWGQGVGAGIRRVACGGIGMLLDGTGDDAYEYDYFGHGGGYWMGVGIARDFSGNDVRYAATSTMYDGTARREARWQRFGAGFGCHYAIGYLFDDAGNDVYGGTIMGVGMGWDLGAGFLVDFGGDDSFEATGGITQGSGAEGSIGVLMNYRGDDAYNGSYQGYAAPSISYHAPSNCGANFSFVIDHGGKDTYGGSDNYGRRIQNNAITQRGNVTGMVVDRPAPEESTNDKQESGDAARQQTAPQRKIVTSKGMPVQPASIRTMAAPPPLYDTTPHATSSGNNAFNPSANEGGFRGLGIFGGRLL